ncbi:MAG: hypothetical protein DI533_11665 [Cereibacter sphaeroides]|uniref:Uncharacterized protein n=1 Tax=Cereibacter sphaeroides TaxID=1063 RepID=A0A2W5S7L9_CERSP|nr:MAG: hypothetical protein DI533_11665 [Cereibacter sphaeroides]
MTTEDPQAEPRQVPLAWHERPGWKSIKAVVELIGIFGGVLGVAFVGYQLQDAQKSQRIERSLGLVERFNQPLLAGAIETLRVATQDMNAQLPQKGSDGKPAGFNKADADKIAVYLTSSQDEDTRRNQAALITAARFFDEVNLCVRAGLCDREIVCLYLTVYAGQLDQTLGAGLAAYNRNSGGVALGEGLRAVAGYQCAPS